MKILILGLNYAPEPIGIAVYTTGMAEHLAARGHAVQVLAATPYYPDWRPHPDYPRRGHRPQIENGVAVRRVGHYVPRHPSGGKRVLHHLSFAASAALPLFHTATRFKPDVMIAIAPSLIGATNAAAVGALLGIPTWLHVQDFEVDAATAVGLLPAGRLAKTAQRLERQLLSRFDIVSTISPAMSQRLLSKGCNPDRVREFRNWATVERSPAVSCYRSEWNITARHVALYSGNIAEKQGVEIIVDAARLLQHRSDLAFVICGQGPQRASLENSCRNLPNVLIRDLQPPERLDDLLALADVHLLPQKAGAADLLFPSKLANMLASGRPVVATALPGTGLFEEVCGCGLVTPPGDAARFAGAIEQVLADDAQMALWSTAARKRAEEHWSPHAILARFEQQLEALVATRQLSTEGLVA